jgi:hypothetical protein
MKKYKPSELPVDTVIYERAFGQWTKGQLLDGRKIWVPDTASIYNEDELAISDEKADETIKNFDIIALPIEVVNYIVEAFATMTGSETILDEAIESIQTRKTNEEV